LTKAGATRIARQQWRARIETASRRCWLPIPTGGIARQQWRARIETEKLPLEAAGFAASPASNGGRGLKHIGRRKLASAYMHRPPAMAGAD